MSSLDVVRSLAQRVRAALGDGNPVPLDHLEQLFGALFFASLFTEEQKPIRFTVVYVDPNDPDPTPPPRPVPQDRVLVPLRTRIPAKPERLAKLARAVHPSEALLAVYSDEQGVPFVWGLVDQVIHAEHFERHARGSFRPIGRFTATVMAPGVLRVDDERGPIAVIRRDTTITGFSNVFLEGPVAELLRHDGEKAARRVARGVGRTGWAGLAAEYRAAGFTPVGTITSQWIETFVRVVVLLQDGGHGGAILMVPGPPTRDLRIGYPLRYSRIGTSFVDGCVANIRDRLALPVGRGMRDPAIDFSLREDELEGAVRFVVGMTRIDGALVMNRRLEVLGFGAEIATRGDGIRVFRAEVSSPSAPDLQQVELTRYGTRHRSMFRYCAAHAGSLGIVVSDDGDLRVVTRIGANVVFWENVATRTSEMLHYVG